MSTVSSSSPQAVRKKSDHVNPLFAGLSGAARPVKTRSRTPEIQATKGGGGGGGRVSGSTSAVRTTKGETTSSNLLLDLEVTRKLFTFLFKFAVYTVCLWWRNKLLNAFY